MTRGRTAGDGRRSRLISTRRSSLILPRSLVPPNRFLARLSSPVGDIPFPSFSPCLRSTRPLTSASLARSLASSLSTSHAPPRRRSALRVRLCTFPLIFPPAKWPACTFVHRRGVSPRRFVIMLRVCIQHISSISCAFNHVSLPFLTNCLAVFMAPTWHRSRFTSLPARCDQSRRKFMSPPLFCVRNPQTCASS